MTHQKVADSLKSVLANSYVLYLKTQNYHWNVTGPNFKSYHLMFEEQYNDLFTKDQRTYSPVSSLRIITSYPKAPSDSTPRYVQPGILLN